MSFINLHSYQPIPTMDFPSNIHEEYMANLSKYMELFKNDTTNPSAMFFLMYNLDENNTAFRFLNNASIEDMIVLFYMSGKQSPLLGNAIMLAANKLRQDEGDNYLKNITDESI